MLVLGLLVVLGILKGFLIVVVIMGLINILVGVYEVFYVVSDVFFYFMLIIFGFLVGKVFKMN